MLQNHHLHQGLMVEDHQALGMMGFFSNPSNSNSLAFLHHLHDDHHHHFSNSSHDQVHGHGHDHQPLMNPFTSILPSSIPSDDGDLDVDDDVGTPHEHHAPGIDPCQALWISCSNPNPRDSHHHQDHSSIMGVPPHSISLQRSDPIWEWRSNGSESMISKRSISGDTERSVEDHHDDNVDIGNDNMLSKKNSLGGLALRMKKMKGRRTVRDPRFCFKTLSDVDVLDDGYKWRKYGQKVVKNTQHPRSYYRCTQDSCRVKKRVERLAEDPRMVITTYEGRHVHSPSHENRDEDSNKALPILNNFFW